MAKRRFSPFGGRRPLAIVLMLIALWVGCKSVDFRSDPVGATLTVDGDVEGQTPCSVLLWTFTWTTHDVKLSKPGYKTLDTTVTGEKFSPVWLITALLVWPPIFFLAISAPEDQYTFRLRPEDRQAEASVSATADPGKTAAPLSKPSEKGVQPAAAIPDASAKQSTAGTAATPAAVAPTKASDSAVEAIYCPQCGTKSAGANKFCSSCGQVLRTP